MTASTGNNEVRSSQASGLGADVAGIAMVVIVVEGSSPTGPVEQAARTIDTVTRTEPNRPDGEDRDEGLGGRGRSPTRMISFRGSAVIAIESTSRELTPGDGLLLAWHR